MTAKRICNRCGYVYYITPEVLEEEAKKHRIIYRDKGRAILHLSCPKCKSRIKCYNLTAKELCAILNSLDKLNSFKDKERIVYGGIKWANQKQIRRNQNAPKLSLLLMPESMFPLWLKGRDNAGYWFSPITYIIYSLFVFCIYAYSISKVIFVLLVIKLKIVEFSHNIIYHQ